MLKCRAVKVLQNLGPLLLGEEDGLKEMPMLEVVSCLKPPFSLY